MLIQQFVIIVGLLFSAAFSKLKKTDIYKTVEAEAAKVLADCEAGPSTSSAPVVAKPSSGNSVLVSPKQVNFHKPLNLQLQSNY